jgi:hypothetical protein
VQDLIVAERFGDAIDGEHRTATGALRLEPKRRIPARALRQHLERLGLLLDHPQLALRLPRLARLRAEPIDELLMVRDLTLPRLDVLFPPIPLRLLCLQEVTVVPRVGEHRLVVDVEDRRADVVEEAVVVGDHHGGSREFSEERLQPADRENVEVISGLVEQQHVRRARQHLRQEHAQAKAA